MRRFTQTCRRDANEKAIKAALEALGATIYGGAGKGAPDLFVYLGGRWTAIEVKAATGTLTPAQTKSHQWAPVHVVRSVDEALSLFGIPPVAQIRSAWQG